MLRRADPGGEWARLDPDTVAIRAGRGAGLPGEPLCPPPVLASAFRANGSLGYAREGNPTWEALEEAVGALDGGASIAFSSGMGAAAAILEGLAASARVAVAASTHVEVRRLLADRARGGKLRVREFDAVDTAEAEAAASECDLLWLDTPSNPMLEIAEIDAIGRRARARGATLVVDATLATPVLQRPLEQGADIVLHSATKYIGGHSDALLGVVTVREAATAERLRGARMLLGAAPGALEAFLVLRGLRTLPLRVRRACESATEIARRLRTHPGVRRVHHPGLPGDPGHERAARLMDGFGAMVSFEVEGGAPRADAVCAAARVFTHATSLGGVESLIERRSRWPGEERIPEGLLRASVGCEDPEDLWEDLSEALRRSRPATGVSRHPAAGDALLSRSA